MGQMEGCWSLFMASPGKTWCRVEDTASESGSHTAWDQQSQEQNITVGWTSRMNKPIQSLRTPMIMQKNLLVCQSYCVQNCHRKTISDLTCSFAPAQCYNITSEYWFELKLMDNLMSVTQSISIWDGHGRGQLFTAQQWHMVCAQCWSVHVAM